MNKLQDSQKVVIYFVLFGLSIVIFVIARVVPGTLMWHGPGHQFAVDAYGKSAS